MARLPLPLARRFTALHPRSVLPAAVLAATLLLAACGTTVVNPVSGESERTVMDEPAEIEEGRRAHQQVLAETPAYANPRLQAYVSGLGAKLATASHRAQLAWTFTVLDSPEVNAFALPGGYVYVTRGILPYLENEAELAGVIGHEIGHVTARHGAQQATRAQDAGWGVLAATVVGAALEVAGVRGATDLAGRVSQTVAAGRLARYSREQESQADALGAEYLVRSRYDPRNMIDVIGVLKSQERFAADAAKAEGRAAPAGSSWLASHPSNDQRLADIRNVALQWADRQGDWADDGRARYLQAIDGITFGDGRAQGVVRGRNFFHEDLGIALTAPAGWQVVNQADDVLLVNPAGDAALVMQAAPPQAGSTPDEVLRKLLQATDGRSERFQLNGLAAMRFTGLRRTAAGQVQPLKATVVEGPGQPRRYYVLRSGAREPAALQRAAGALAEAEASFRPLSAAERAAARPWVLKTVPMPRGGFAELARHAPLPTLAEAQLRLLNGVYAGGAEPAPGTAVKTVQ